MKKKNNQKVYIAKKNMPILRYKIHTRSIPMSTVAPLLDGSAVVVHNTGHPDLLTSVSYIFISGAHKNSGVPAFTDTKEAPFLAVQMLRYTSQYR